MVNKMKKFIFPIDKYQAAWALSPIRTKPDVIDLLMRLVKVMSLGMNAPTNQSVASVVLTVSKMSRLFLVSPNKIFSINFPFRVEEEAGVLRFQSHAHKNVDSRATSNILALLANQDLLSSFEILHFAEPILDASTNDSDIWALFRELLLFEDGYIRYDNDLERQNGHRHPLHHLDIFYSNSSTFKLGLHSGISSGDFEDLLDTETDCHFVRKLGSGLAM